MELNKNIPFDIIFEYFVSRMSLDVCQKLHELFQLRLNLYLLIAIIVCQSAYIFQDKQTNKAYAKS